MTTSAERTGRRGAAAARLRTEDIAGARSVDVEDFIEVEAVQEKTEPERAALFGDESVRNFRSQWQDIQTAFVDDPRSSVQQADELVAELMQNLARHFAQQRDDLEKQWDAAQQVSTEDLRVALQQYRAFFERLLAV